MNLIKKYDSCLSLTNRGKTMSKEDVKRGWADLGHYLKTIHPEPEADRQLNKLREMANLLTDAGKLEFIKDAREEAEKTAMEDESAKKKARTEQLRGVLQSQTQTQSQTDSSQPAATPGKTILENRPEQKLRLLQSKYLAEVKQGKTWCFSPGFKAFLLNRSLPAKFDSRLVKLVNESVFSIKAFDLMRAKTNPTEKDFAKIGEMVYAQSSAQAFLLFAAWYKESYEAFCWDEKLLSSSLAEQTKLLIALALRDVEGLGQASQTLGDIFFEPKKVGGAADDDLPAAGRQHAGVKLGRDLKEITLPEWALTKPPKISSNLQCNKCSGWGHKSPNCPSPQKCTFTGACSKCHGKGHKAPECTSK